MGKGEKWSMKRLKDHVVPKLEIDRIQRYHMVHAENLQLPRTARENLHKQRLRKRGPFRMLPLNSLNTHMHFLTAEL